MVRGDRPARFNTQKFSVKTLFIKTQLVRSKQIVGVARLLFPIFTVQETFRL